MVSSRSVGELAEDLPVLDGGQPAYEALGLFREHDLLSFPVRLEKGYGVIQAHSMLKVKSPDTKLASFAKRVPSLSPEQGLGVAARLMVENRVQILPVVDGGRLLGVVRADRLLSEAGRRGFKGLSVSDVMTSNPICVGAGDFLGRAVRLLSENRIDHLPVLRRGRVVGVVRSKEVLLVLLSPGEKLTRGGWGLEALSQKRVPVGEVALEPVVSEVGEDYASALRRVLGSKSTYTLVVLGEELQGIATLRDFLKPLAERERVVELPVQISGLGDDILADEAVKQKVRALALYASKTIPSVFEIRVNVKRVGPSKKAYEVGLQLHTPRKTVNLSGTGYDLLKVFDEIQKKMRQFIRQEVSPPKKRFPKRMD